VAVPVDDGRGDAGDCIVGFGDLDGQAILERAAGDAMAFCGELRGKLEAYEQYRPGLTADAAAELERLTEAAESIWRAVQKI